MLLLLASEEDPASRNIRKCLLGAERWRERGSFHGRPVWERPGMVLASIKGIHLYADLVEQDFQRATSSSVDQVLFLSRHKAASGIPTLTIHPIGNYGKADFGGKDGRLVKAAPSLMTGLLLNLAKEGKGLPFQISYEVTHHGPWLETPTAYIEIGSGPEQWQDLFAAEALARTILGIIFVDDPVAIGIGGGHYAPRFSELSLSRHIAFGHMIPNYAIEKADDASTKAMISQAIEQSDAKLVYIHRKSMARSRAAAIRETCTSLGYRVVESSDLEPR